MPAMIKNDQEYETTKYWVERFANHLNSLRKRPRETLEIHPLMAKAQENAVKSQLENLKAQVCEYENLKAGRFCVDKLNLVHEVPLVLIKARIAQRLSQKELAERVGLTEEQIKRYEADDYSSATLATMRNVATVLYYGVVNPSLLTKGG